MTRRVALALSAAVAIALSVLSGLLPAISPNAFFALFMVDLAIPLVGFLAAFSAVIRHPDLAPGMVGIGVYALALAGVCALLPFRWFPTDNAGIGLLLLALLWGLLGLTLLLYSAIQALRRHQGTAAARSLGYGVVAAIISSGLLLARGPSDWASRTTSVQLYGCPVFILIIVLSLAILDLVDPRPREGAAPRAPGGA